MERLPVNFTGAANLKSPIGACPYRIPKYSETCELFFAACPVTGPLLVCTVCPIVQPYVRSSSARPWTQTPVASAANIEGLIAATA